MSRIGSSAQSISEIYRLITCITARRYERLPYGVTISILTASNGLASELHGT